MTFDFARDATATSATGAIAMLAVYAAALIFVLQHVAERYTPALYPLIARRALLWLLPLALLVAASASLAWAPQSATIEIAAVVILLVAVALALLGAYQTWRMASSGPAVAHMIARLPRASQVSATVDVLVSAISRADTATAISALANLEPGSEAQAQVVARLSQHRHLVQPEWVSSELILSTRGGLADEGARRLREPISVLLDLALADEDYHRAETLLRDILDDLEETKPFLEPQGELLFDCGFTVWHRGEEGASEPRQSDQQRRLANTKDTFLIHLTEIWRAILARRVRPEVTAFASAFSRLQQADVPVVHHSSILYSILEDGGACDLLEQLCLEQLAVAVGGARRLDSDTEVLMDEDYLDSLAELVALWVAELGSPDQVGRVLGNAGVHRSGKPTRLVTQRDFSATAETAVADALPNEANSSLLSKIRKRLDR